MAKKHSVKSALKKEQKEYEEEVLQIARVTRVVKGGRRLRFKAAAIIGNKKGKVGIGLGKSTEVSSAIQKAITKAKKNIIKVPIVNETIPHEVKIKFKSASILIMPASKGTGIVAGGATRKILDLAGVQNVFGKTFRSNNKVVNAQATIKALELLHSAEEHPNYKKNEAKNKNETSPEKEIKKEKTEKTKAAAA